MVIITKEHFISVFSGCTILQCNTMQVYYDIKILATELSLSIWSNFKVFFLAFLQDLSPLKHMNYWCARKVI